MPGDDISESFSIFASGHSISGTSTSSAALAISPQSHQPNAQQHYRGCFRSGGHPMAQNVSADTMKHIGCRNFADRNILKSKKLDLPGIYYHGEKWSLLG